MGRSLIIFSTNSLQVFSTSPTKRSSSVPITNYQPNPPFPSLRLTLTGTCTSTGTRPSRVPFPSCLAKPGKEIGVSSESEDVGPTAVIQVVLWAMEAVYILWLFLLPFAPGDPVWAINQNTINDLLGLSLNFFFILPLLNSVGINLIEAPVLHPVDGRRVVQFCDSMDFDVCTFAIHRLQERQIQGLFRHFMGFSDVSYQYFLNTLHGNSTQQTRSKSISSKIV